jgi:chromosome segregation protein
VDAGEERNRDARAQKQDLIAQRQQEAAAFEAEREGVEAQLAELQRSWMGCAAA